MQLSIQSNTQAIALAGALEINDAEDSRKALAEALSSRAELAFDLGRLEGCDTAGAQLLLSLGKSALLAGKSIRFENVPQPVLEIWAKLGLPAEYFINKN